LRPDDPGALSLLVIDGGVVSSHSLPPAGSITLGRSRKSTIALEDGSVSRHHAEIEVGGTVVVRDLESANGVRVRGQRVAAGVPVPIAPGDVVELGSVTVVLQFASPRVEPSSTASGRETVATRLTIPPPAPAIAAASDDGPLVVDPAMVKLHDLARKVANSGISVLLLGETGVGKEVFAQVIHDASPRRAQPFLQLNCAALSPTLLESELFGHERGAFTGAVQAKPGLLESADRGTVFLDEIGELPAPLQAKLLRVIEERRITRVGGLSPRAIDVRFISATHRDLLADIATGAFRRDLYFRLNGISMLVPPLRERVGEIVPLAERFLARAAADSGLATVPRLGREAIAALDRYRWPGNVRELRNAMDRAALVCGSALVEPEHLPPEILAGASDRRSLESASDASSRGLRTEIEALERKRILDALDACAGNQTRAAERLGMPLRTLVAKLGTYDIPRPRKPRPVR
jgi:DNA-binding NtrC family response regulator